MQFTNNWNEMNKGLSALYALGRLRKNEKNKTETAFENLLIDKKNKGEILWYAFESVKLIIAPNTSITVDYFVMLSSGELQAIDVKGSRSIIQEDSKVKMKVAASMFPFRFFYAFPNSKRSGGGFEIEQILND